MLARAGVVLLTAGALSACQLPDVSMSPPMSDSSPTTARSTASPSSSAAAESPAEVDAAAATSAAPVEVVPVEPVRPAGELDVGSTTHVLTAGERDLVVDWWTDQAAVDWRAEDTKTLQLSAHLEGGDPDAEVLVLVTRFAAVLDDGTARTQVEEDSGEFVIQAPYTYGTVLTLPPSATDTTSLTVSLQFDLLIETEPGSERYFRQTVLDTLVLPLAVQETP